MADDNHNDPETELRRQAREFRENDAREMRERRIRASNLYPVLKRFDGLGDDYVRAMGGQAAYNRFIRRVNPNAPPFDPNAQEPFETHTNCYDYGVNDPDRVGNASDPSGITSRGGSPRGFARFINEAIRGVQRDGAHYIKPADLPRWAENGLRQDHYLMAMYVRSQMMGETPATETAYDYHFVRQDQQGGFSHKQGLLHPKQTDRDRNPIVDPIGANMGNYVFVGFFAVPRNGLDVGAGPRHARVDGQVLPPEQRRALDEQLLPASALNPLGGATPGHVSKADLARQEQPAILLAIDRGDRVAISAYIEAGGDINIRGNLIKEEGSAFDSVFYRAEKVTPLMWAVQRGDIDTVRLLLAAGADTSLLDLNGWSALEYASGEAMISQDGIPRAPDTTNEMYKLIKAHGGSSWGFDALGNFFGHIMDSEEITALTKQLEPMMPFLQGNRFWDKDDSGLIEAHELAHVLVENGITKIEDVNGDKRIDYHDLTQQWNTRMAEIRQSRGQ